jgi:integrase
MFVSFVGDKYIHLVRPLDLERYKNLRLPSVTPTTVNIELRTIKAMFGYALKWGLLEQSPCRNVPQVKIPEQPPAYLTQEQVMLLLEKIEDPNFRLLVEFAVHTGMRRGEILNLKWDHVDLASRMITVRSEGTFKTKSGRVHHIPMNEVVYHILATKKRGSEFVFVTTGGRKLLDDFVTHRFKKYVRKAGLSDHIHFHSLRHTFASLLAKAGVPLFDIQKLLNHRHITTTQIYSHLSPEHLRASVERLVITKN